MKKIFFIAAVALIVNANAQSKPDLNTLLVGKWAQVGPGRLIEQVLAFNPDHSFAMYPKCGRETEQLKKAGLSVFPGTWSIIEGNTLRIGLQHAGKTANLDASIEVVGTEVRVTNSQGYTNTMIRYEGVLPPSCAAKQ